MSEDDSPLILISDIYEVNMWNDFLQDPEVTSALNKVTKILANPGAGGSQVTRSIVQCTAWSNSFSMKAKYYMIIGKSEENASQKKNIYMTLSANFLELAGSLKYVSKAEH